MSEPLLDRLAVSNGRRSGGPRRRPDGRQAIPRLPGKAPHPMIVDVRRGTP